MLCFQIFVADRREEFRQSSGPVCPEVEPNQLQSVRKKTNCPGEGKYWQCEVDVSEISMPRTDRQGETETEREREGGGREFVLRKTTRCHIY